MIVSSDLLRCCCFQELNCFCVTNTTQRLNVLSCVNKSCPRQRPHPSQLASRQASSLSTIPSTPLTNKCDVSFDVVGFVALDQLHSHWSPNCRFLTGEHEDYTLTCHEKHGRRHAHAQNYDFFNDAFGSSMTCYSLLKVVVRTRRPSLSSLRPLATQADCSVFTC